MGYTCEISYTLLDFEPEKISIETENNANNNNIKVLNIRYNNHVSIFNHVI